MIQIRLIEAEDIDDCEEEANDFLRELEDDEVFSVQSHTNRLLIEEEESNLYQVCIVFRIKEE